MNGVLAALAVTVTLAAVAVAGGPVVLVKEGEARCAIVVGRGSAAPERNIARVLAARIRKRTGCDVPIVDERKAERAAAKGQVKVVVGAPSGNALSRQLCEQAGKLVATPEAVGPGGFVIHTLESGGSTWIVVAGPDPHGTVCAVGKLFRKLDFADRDVTVERLEVVDKIDPAKVMLAHKSTPAQWGNSFKDAPIAMIREYFEGLAMWGTTSVWNLCGYWINNPFKEGVDARSREKWERVRDLYLHAQALGMEVGYTDDPTSVWDDQLHLRKLGGKFRYPVDVCPSIPEARKVLLENRRLLYRALKEAGVEVRHVLHLPHDHGGCDCQKCAPLMRTFLKLSEEIHAIGSEYHPRIKVYICPWMCTGEETRMMFDYIHNERPTWVGGLIHRPGVKLPKPYLSVGWQTIFGCGPWECYGKMGADPLPRFLPRQIQAFHKRGLRAVFEYTEGPYTDINSAIVAQVCRHPFTTDVRQVLTEYCHSNFGTSNADSAALADLILAKFKHSKAGAFNASLRVEAPEEVLAALEAIETRMPAWGRDGWRYGILKIRVQLEVLDKRARATAGWFQALDGILADPALHGDDAALASAVKKGKTYLGELEATCKQLEGEPKKLTRRLYVDLYGSPNRHSAHGSFRLALPWRTLVPLTIRLCGELEAEKDAAKRRQRVLTLLRTLRLRGKHGTTDIGAKPVLRPKGALVIPGTRFRGGAGWAVRADHFLYNHANLIDRAGSRYSAMHVEFDFEQGEEPLRQPVRLTLRGTHHTRDVAPIEITVNGHTLFSGKNGFKRYKFSECVYAIRPEHIVAGKNRLEIKNLARGPGQQPVLIASATLEVH